MTVREEQSSPPGRRVARVFVGVNNTRVIAPVAACSRGTIQGFPDERDPLLRWGVVLCAQNVAGVQRDDLLESGSKPDWTEWGRLGGEGKRVDLGWRKHVPQHIDIGVWGREEPLVEIQVRWWAYPTHIPCGNEDPNDRRPKWANSAVGWISQRRKENKERVLLWFNSPVVQDAWNSGRICIESFSPDQAGIPPGWSFLNPKTEVIKFCGEVGVIMRTIPESISWQVLKLGHEVTSSGFLHSPRLPLREARWSPLPVTSWKPWKTQVGNGRWPDHWLLEWWFLIERSEIWTEKTDGGEKEGKEKDVDGGLQMNQEPKILDWGIKLSSPEILTPLNPESLEERGDGRRSTEKPTSADTVIDILEELGFTLDVEPFPGQTLGPWCLHTQNPKGKKRNHNRRSQKNKSHKGIATSNLGETRRQRESDSRNSRQVRIVVLRGKRHKRNPYQYIDLRSYIHVCIR